MVIAHLATAMCGLVKTLNFYKITFQLATLVQPFSVKLHVKLTSTKLSSECVCVSKDERAHRIHTYTDKYSPIVLYQRISKTCIQNGALNSTSQLQFILSKNNVFEDLLHFFTTNFPAKKNISFFLIWLTLDQFVSLAFFPFCLCILHVLSY